MKTEEIRALLEGATPGEWTTGHHGTYEVQAGNVLLADCDGCEYPDDCARDYCANTCEADWGYESSVTIALVDLPDPRDAEIAALRARLEHRDAWLTLIDGGDRPCDDPAQLREWAMRALRGDEVPE